MKKVSILIIFAFLSSMFLTTGLQATTVFSKDPCIKKCQINRDRCIKAAKKNAKAIEKCRAKFAQCKQQCKAKKK